MTSAAPQAERTAGLTWGRGSALARVTAALEAADCGPVRGGKAKCPAHPDRTPSLGVGQGERGAVLRCYAGCKTDHVLRALRLEAVEIFDAPPEKTSRRTNGAAPLGPIVATYDYTDERGELLYQCVRYDPKDFRQRRPDGAGGWIWNLGDTRRVLYKIADVLRAVGNGDPVLVVEGERDADAAWAAGHVATTNVCGAKARWRTEDSEALRGADVVIVADKDEPGRKHALEVMASLRGVARSVEIREAKVGKDLADHLAAGLGVAELVAIADPELAPAETVAAPDSGAVAFTGARLLALLERPPLAPIEAGIPPPGHLTLLVAPSFTGKTSLVCWLGMSRASGVAPWAGASPLEPGRVLLVSLDEAAEQVARRMHSLAAFHPGGRLEKYAERIVVIGPDREIQPNALDVLRFDAEGLEALERLIVRAREAAAPFREVYLDAFADFLPLGQSENSNEEGTRIGGALEGIAVRTGTAVQLLHHTGKPSKDAKDDALPDLRFIGRGNSALMAKARVVTALELMAGQPHLRRVRTITNLTRAPRPAFFEVASEKGSESDLLYFRSFDPLSAYDPADFLAPDEEPISTTTLAWRLQGKEPETGKAPPGEAKTLATTVREGWEHRGLIDVFDGPRNAKLIRLKRRNST